MPTTFVIIFFRGAKFEFGARIVSPFSRSAKTIPLTGCDVISRAEDRSFMAETKKSRPGKRYCAAGGLGAINCANKTGTPGITMHYFPKDETLRQKWTRFVRIHRKDFVPTKSSALCSAHFDETCFHFKSITALDGSGNPVNQKRRLSPGSISSKDAGVPHTSLLTSRKRRMVSRQQ